MDSKIPIRQLSLSNQILDILIGKIRNGDFPLESPLPPENQLAAEFKVSRATIRSAFDRLETVGLIMRRQGVGTFVCRSSNLSNPLNQFIEFMNLIKNNEYTPGFVQLSAEMVEPSPKLTAELHLESGTKVLQILKVFFADGDPIIYCINRIPQWVFEDTFTIEQVIQPGLTEPFFDFFEKKCNQRINYYISSVRADILSNCHPPDLFNKMDPLTPVLIIDNIGYNGDDRPFHQSVEHHPGNRMEFKLIRGR